MKKCTIILTLLVSLISSIILFSQTIPQTVNYQGVLKDAAGVVVTNGDYNITFKLYSTESGGTELWTETKLITVSDGIINTQLGSATLLNLPFDAAYWLGITVSTGSELTPRIKLSSVPYSFMTMNVMDGSITTAKLQDGAVTTNKIADNSITSSKIIDGTITDSDIGANQVIKKINGIKDSINILAGSNVTITPSGNTITINASGGSSGTITGVTAGTGLTGGGTSGNVTLSIAENGITTVMLQDNTVTSSKIVDGTLLTADISDNSITSAKIVNGTIVTSDLSNNSITTDKIVDGTITANDIGNNQVIKKVNGIRDSINFVAGTNISITPTGNTITITSTGGTGNGDITSVTAGSGLTGGGTTGDVTLSIPNSGITTAMLQDNAVTSAKITDASITSADILDGTIATGDLSDNSITTNKIADGTIAAADLANSSVTSAKIVDGTIVTADLGDNSVTSNKIVDGTITAADIGGTQVVKAVNNIKDNVTLVAGSNVTITPSGQNLTISSTAGGIGGTGTTNYIPKFTAVNTIGNSSIYQSAAGNIGINTTNPGEPLDVNGDIELGTTQTIKLRSKIGPSGNYGLTINMDNLEYYSFDRLGTATFTGKLGIGTSSPQYPLHTSTNRKYAGYFTSDSLSHITHVIHGEFTGTGKYDPIGVYGKSIPSDNYGYGGSFEGGRIGVLGRVIALGTLHLGYCGVWGYVSSGTSAGCLYGVYAHASDGDENYGVYAYAGGATANWAGNYGVYAYATGGTTNWAGYFSGNVNVTGTISKAGGSFKIDHPLEPANKYLYHSFVESPDMMNIYNGNVVTDGSGYATVTLPDWFEALNKDFRYQLTVISDFAQAIISQKVQGNQFAIRTDKPNIEVSWQVTGIRKDAWAEKNRIPVEELKKGDEVGKYIHPEVFGKPETAGVDYEKKKRPEERKLER